MSSIRALLEAVSEDQFMAGLDKMANENEETAAPAPAPKATKTASQKKTAEPVGAATQGNPIGGNVQVTGGISAGEPQADVLAEQLGDNAENRRIQLQQMALRAAGQQQAAGVEASRGPGTDEGHNAGIQPRTGRQEYANIAAPATQMLPESMAQTPSMDQVAGSKAASTGIDALLAQLLGESNAAAATKTAAPAATEQQDGTEKTAAEQIAEECLAQGRFVELGFRMGLNKAAEDGSLGMAFLPAIAAVHEVAIEKLAESPVLDKLAEALADKFVEKLQAKVAAKK
jgi:hypothetical protein